MATVESSTRTLISPARLNRPSGKRIYWLLAVLIVVACSLACRGPLSWPRTGGLKTAEATARVPPTLTPTPPQLGNYRAAWTSLTLGRLLLNPAWYAFGALAFQLVLDVMAAYAFSK